MAWPRKVTSAWAKPERLAGGDPDLGRDHVDAGQHLGDRVLDLDPAVDLDEVEVAGGVDEELERADVLVAGRDGGPDGALRELGPGRVREGRRRRLLDDLLVAALDRAVALAEVDAVAVAVDGDLDLDVAVLVEPLLEVERVVAERRLRLGAADPQRRFELAPGADHAHALAAAAGRRLDEHRVADPLRLAERVHLVAEHAVRARDRRQAVRAEELARPGLAREALEDGRRRPDEGQAVGGDDLGEALVLGQEAVARVDRVAAGDERGRDDRRRRQVRPPRVGRADADRLVGELDRRASRGPPRCRRRPPRPRARGTPAGCAARSRRGWR